MNSIIKITKPAWSKIHQIIKSNSNNHALLFYANSGGCNGFNYELSTINKKEVMPGLLKSPDAVDGQDYSKERDLCQNILKINELIASCFSPYAGFALDANINNAQKNICLNFYILLTTLYFKNLLRLNPDFCNNVNQEQK